MANTIEKLTSITTIVEEIRRARVIMETTQCSAESFLKTYEIVRKPSEGKKTTSTTDEQQDILRAMLVFTAAGLDSCLKQLIRDSLPKLSEKDIEVKQRIMKYCAKQLSNISDSNKSSSLFLSRLLFSNSTKTSLIEEYINYLTGSSLQSVDEVKRVTDALNIDRSVSIDIPLLKEIFSARNNIIHELDIDFTKHRRIRTQRRQAEMIDFTNALIKIGDNIVSTVNDKLIC